MPNLFDPIDLGDLACPNRIVMAPLTRGRADRAGVHGPLAVEYYRQRADAGLIISEATGISREGLGWPYAPGLWSERQVEGWKPVTEAVHAAGGRIVAQLWHMGRLVHPDLGGGPPVSASATRGPHRLHTYEGKKDPVTARALTRDEIARVVGDYVHAAANAIRAGFDGVQVHGANGYLVDQFLRDSANHRDDDYGGSAENRMRFLREILLGIGGEIGMGRTGLRLSPIGEVNGVDDSAPEDTFTKVAAMLEEIGLPWLEMREPGDESSFVAAAHERVSPAMQEVFSGPIGLNSDLDRASGQALLDAGTADFIAFGRPFIANPDLVRRLREDAPLNAPDPATFYSRGAEGYVDYPQLEEAPAR
ncbi:alkene reductase [Sphingomicrobium astaxanthinifaciens]|uniref:alkene reductase n=1 Tax=Sphingomicrobium astaxanthinifaciens TaxID=1227949 RepID=UPI001FCB827E|nr:alkene reductase [Sphingomicrobium astaxanthinifaciens]MCJ7421136.1 alkene reductase [Sphingomicrobium astaxanthinifaciens]